MFKIKVLLAYILYYTGISNLLLKRLNRKTHGQYIRVINYHHIMDEVGFKKQIVWLKERFRNVNYDDLNSFFESGRLSNNAKPGIVISFDDGYMDNYEKGVPELNKEKMTGWFMVSSDKVSCDGYMTWEQLNELIKMGHVLGCHTATHHRMEEDDNDRVLEYEVKGSKKKIEENVKKCINIFCWCGGEEKHYTRNAQKYIVSAGYKYSFMTNSYPVFMDTDKLHIQRTNIEDTWSLPLVLFQLCGLMDIKYKQKRCRVNDITDIDKLDCL